MGEIHDDTKFFPLHDDVTGLHISNYTEAQSYSKHLLQTIKSTGGDSCHATSQPATKYYDLDDESYLHDGKMLPRPGWDGYPAQREVDTSASAVAVAV